MEYKKLGPTDDYKPFGVEVDREYLDGNLNAVTVTFDDGTHFKVMKKGWDAFEFCLPKPKKIFIVSGRLGADEEYSKTFTKKLKAEEFICQCEDHNLDIKEEESLET